MMHSDIRQSSRVALRARNYLPTGAVATGVAGVLRDGVPVGPPEITDEQARRVRHPCRRSRRDPRLWAGLDDPVTAHRTYRTPPARWTLFTAESGAL